MCLNTSPFPQRLRHLSSPPLLSCQVPLRSFSHHHQLFSSTVNSRRLRRSARWLLFLLWIFRSFAFVLFFKSSLAGSRWWRVGAMKNDGLWSTSNVIRKTFDFLNMAYFPTEAKYSKWKKMWAGTWFLSRGNWLDHEQWAFCARMEPEVNTSLHLIILLDHSPPETRRTLTFEDMKAESHSYVLHVSPCQSVFIDSYKILGLLKIPLIFLCSWGS